jgi:hypothetical protein
MYLLDVFWLEPMNGWVVGKNCGRRGERDGGGAGVGDGGEGGGGGGRMRSFSLLSREWEENV